MASIDKNPANNPQFLFELMDNMEADASIRNAVHEQFYLGDLSFLLHDTQLEMRTLAYNPAHDEILIFSSRQLGKSFWVIAFAIEHCLKNPRALVRIFSDTIDQVNDIVADNLELIQMLAPEGLIKRTKSDKRWRVGAGQIRLGPLAAAHVDGKRGGNATLIILEEGCFVPSDEYKSAIGSVIGPQLLRSGGKLVHVTTPSKDLQHYVHTTVLPRCEVAGSVARYDIYKNPQITEDKIVKARERCTTEEEWQREYMVQIIRDEQSTVVPEFNAERHITTQAPPRYAHWLTSLDFGGVMDKHGILLCYYDFERAKFVVHDELLLERNTSTKVIREKTAVLEKQGQWLGDGYVTRISDSPGQILVDLREEGFNVRPPKKAAGSWEADINMVRLGFSRNEIEVHERCRWTIATLQYGQYTSNRKDFKRTEELGHLDLLSALKYGLRAKDNSNPFPANEGKSRFTHNIPREDAETIETFEGALLGAF